MSLRSLQWKQHEADQAQMLSHCSNCSLRERLIKTFHGKFTSVNSDKNRKARNSLFLDFYCLPAKPSVVQITSLNSAFKQDYIYSYIISTRSLFSIRFSLTSWVYTYQPTHTVCRFLLLVSLWLRKAVTMRSPRSSTNFANRILFSFSYSSWFFGITSRSFRIQLVHLERQQLLKRLKPLKLESLK